MDTATDADHHADHGHDAAHAHSDHHGPTDKQFVVVAIVLAAITGAEVVWSYLGLEGMGFLIPLLLMMALKFVIVVLWFMHLKFDSKWFNMAFWTGLILAMLVYAGALATFKFFV